MFKFIKQNITKKSHNNIINNILNNNKKQSFYYIFNNKQYFTTIKENNSISSSSSSNSNSSSHSNLTPPSKFENIVLASQISVDDPISHEHYQYPIDFKVTTKDIQLAQEGGFVEFTDAELERYLPELASTEIFKYFKTSKRNAFMVREPTKLVCRILDDFAYKIKNGTDSPSPRQGFRFPVELPFWTNNPKQWDNSKFEVFSYGTKDLVRNRNSTKGNMKLVRGPGSTIEETLVSIREKNNGTIPDKVMLTGLKGYGKTICLAHAVYHARTKGWIAVYIPNGYDHVNGGPYVEPATDVTGIPGIFDNTILSAAALRDLWKAHRNELRQIRFKVKSRLNKYEPIVDYFKEEYQKDLLAEGGSQPNFTSLRKNVIGATDTFADEDALDSPILNNREAFDIKTFQVKTLEDICLAGIAFRDYAGAAFIDILEELRSLNDPNRPILIAVDQVNFWDMKSVYKYENNEVKTTDICVPYVTKFLSNIKSENNKTLGNNVFCIGAPTYFYPYSKKELVTYHNLASSLPLTIRVPCYSHVEFLGLCKYYLDIGLIAQGMSNQELLAYRVHVSNIPERARKDATSFFMPIYSSVASTAFESFVSGEIDENESDVSDHENDNYAIEFLENALAGCDPEFENETIVPNTSSESSEDESGNIINFSKLGKYTDESESDLENSDLIIEKIREKYDLVNLDPNDIDVDISKLSEDDAWSQIAEITNEKLAEPFVTDQFPLKPKVPLTDLKTPNFGKKVKAKQ